ncbi:hypothetical protein Ciccas_001586 [Cichlidogyrus casuarinus]|uniref:Uncharacterized protein n=1 Tax=Cichlidogyrus casuarinus TaxID=1844966 RepID=A0ABD2QMQ2_9PLAT
MNNSFENENLTPEVHYDSVIIEDASSNRRLEEMIEQRIKDEFDDISIGEDIDEEDSFITSSISQQLITCKPDSMEGSVNHSPEANGHSNFALNSRILDLSLINENSTSKNVMQDLHSDPKLGQWLDENLKLRQMFNSVSDQLNNSKQSTEELISKTNLAERSYRHTINIQKIEINELKDENSNISKKVDSLLQNIEQLNSELACKSHQFESLSDEKHRLQETISSLEIANSALTNQISELSTGKAIKRVTDLEHKFEETLARRKALDQEAFEDQLNLYQRKLDAREEECQQLKNEAKRLEFENDEIRNKLKSERTKFQLNLDELERINFETTPGSLRERLKEAEAKHQNAETSLKISLDANSLLQHELHDLREQLSIYERALDLRNRVNNKQASSTPRHEIGPKPLQATWSSIKPSKQGSNGDDDTQEQLNKEEDSLELPLLQSDEQKIDLSTPRNSSRSSKKPGLEPLLEQPETGNEEDKMQQFLKNFKDKSQQVSRQYG